MTESTIDYSAAEELGISREAYDEILDIVGRIPRLDELSTLLAMWESNGKQQSLYRWLCGQTHSIHRDDYLYTGASENRSIKEPRIKECLDIAHHLASLAHSRPSPHPLPSGLLIYIVGNISSEFADGNYAKQYLHLVDQPMAVGSHDEDCAYIDLILSSLHSASVCSVPSPVAEGGLFFSLLRIAAPAGFDILSPREVRLDAFLFGEEKGRYIVSLSETEENIFLQKLSESRLNCCFLGRSTHCRILVDGFDFGPASDFL